MDREPGFVLGREGGLRTHDGFSLPDPSWVIGKQALLGVKVTREGARTVMHPVVRRIPFQWQGVHYQDGDDQPFLLLHNSGGGFIEDDSSILEVRTEAGTRCLLTTTGASKFYKCENGGNCTDRIAVDIGPRALFEYLPDEIIPYRDSDSVRIARYDARADSRFFISDILTAGRIGFRDGEAFLFRSMRSEMSVRIDGRLVWMDRLVATSPRAVTDLRELWGGYQVVGTVLAYGNDLPASLDDELADAGDADDEARIAFTRLGSLICIRILANEVWRVHEAVQRCWSLLRPALAHKPARVINKP